MAKEINLLPGSAISALMGRSGLSPEEFITLVDGGLSIHITPSLTVETLSKWTKLNRLSLAKSAFFYRVAAEIRFVWRGNRWIRTNSIRMLGEDVVKLRQRHGLTQTQLAMELDTTQQSVAQWEKYPFKALGGVTTYALRALEHALAERNAEGGAR